MNSGDELIKPMVEQDISQIRIKKNKDLSEKTNEENIVPNNVLSAEQADKMKTILCPIHNIPLLKMGFEYIVDRTKRKYSFPMYKCIKDQKLYTFAPSVHSRKIKHRDQYFDNISELKINEPLQCYVYDGRQYYTDCIMPDCIHPWLSFATISLIPKGKRKRVQFQVKICSYCGMVYVRSAIYEKYRNNFERVCLDNYNIIDNKIDSDNINISKKRAKLSFNDFIVRENIFGCRYKNHTLVNVDATVELVKKNGEIVEKTVAADYCEQCKIYFIMESTYQNLKKYGTLLCRVSDEKTYLKGNPINNGMQLAQQSILMQYGYSVSQEEGLSDKVRQLILARIIDSHILTRNEVINYLDFFINTKSSQDKYTHAIEKWEYDRSFVEKYNIGTYTSVHVDRITRK